MYMYNEAILNNHCMRPVQDTRNGALASVYTYTCTYMHRQEVC